MAHRGGHQQQQQRWQQRDVGYVNDDPSQYQSYGPQQGYHHPQQQQQPQQYGYYPQQQPHPHSQQQQPQMMSHQQAFDPGYSPQQMMPQQQQNSNRNRGGRGASNNKSNNNNNNSVQGGGGGGGATNARKPRPSNTAMASNNAVNQQQPQSNVNSQQQQRNRGNKSRNSSNHNTRVVGSNNNNNNFQIQSPLTAAVAVADNNNNAAPVIDKEDKEKQRALEAEREKEKAELKKKAMLEAEEKARKEKEEKEAEAKRKEEARIAKEAEEAQKAEEARRKARLDMLAMRKTNKSITRPDEAFFKKLDSNFKKNTAFVKKLSKLTDESKDKLCQELLTLNLSRYVSEAVTSLAEARLARPADVSAAVYLCSIMHQRYAEFSKLLISTIAQVFDASSGANSASAASSAASATPADGGPPISELQKKRTTLRLLTELFLVGVFSDASILLGILKELVKSCRNPLLRNSEGEPKDRDPVLTTFHQNMLLVTSFIRLGSEDILGIAPEKREKREGNAEEVALKPEDAVVTPEQQKQFLHVLRIFATTAKEVLVEEHKLLRNTEKENHKSVQAKGELSETEKQNYEKVRKSYERFLSSTGTLCELLGEEMVVLQEDENTTRMVADTSSAAQKNNAKDAKSNEPEPVFEDEDTRSFYEDLPDLRLLVPAVLFGDSDPKGKKDTDDKDSKDTKEKEPSKEKEKEKDTKERDEKDDDKGGKKASDATGGVSLDTWQQRLPNCVNRDLIDKAAIEFCYINTKGNRKQLIKTVFNVPRTQLVLLPYYSRLIAQLNLCMKDVGPMLVAMLEEEFNFLFRKKDQMNIESKIKNIKFLGELCKFKVASHNLIFTCLKECLDDFVHHNIDVACALLETCGRFLYRTPETQVRTKHMLDIMMRLKNIKNLDNRLDTAVENAYYMCIPPDRPARKEKLLPPIVRYIHKLIFDLSKHNVKAVLKQLRKIDWEQHGEVVMHALLNVHKGKFSNIHIVASLSAGLSKYHDTLGVHLVDLLLERIRRGLEVNVFKHQQRRVAFVRFVGEMYNYCMVESSIIFDTLYTLITYKADDYQIDPPDDCFRVRLVCTLLDTCGKYFDRGSSKKRLDRFLVYFQKYYLMKDFIPLDVEFMIADTFDAVRPKYKRLPSFDAAVATVELMEQDEAALGIFTGPMFISHIITGQGTDSVTEDDDDDDEQRRSDEEEDVEEELSSTERGARGLHARRDDDPRAALLQTAVEGGRRGGPGNELDGQQGLPGEVSAPNTANRGGGAMEEDDEFEKELQKMVRESIESRRLESRTSVGNMAVPMDLSRVHKLQQQQQPASADDTTQAVPEEDTHEPETAMPFKLLLRKGNKQQVKQLNIPMECAFAVNRSIQREEEQREHQEIKRRTLQAYDDTQQEEYDAMFNGLPVTHVARHGTRPNQKARRQQQQQQAQTGPRIVMIQRPAQPGGQQQQSQQSADPSRRKR